MSNYPRVKVFIHVLDDDDDDLEFMSHELKKNGVEDFRLFKDSQVFLEATTHGVHIVVLDYSLNGPMDGIEVVEKLLKENPSCYCIMQSGQESKAVVVKAVNAGIRGYIQKGEENYLQKLVMQVLEKKEGAQQIIERHYEEMLSLIKLEQSIDKLTNEL